MKQYLLYKKFTTPANTDTWLYNGDSGAHILIDGPNKLMIGVCHKFEMNSAVEQKFRQIALQVHLSKTVPVKFEVELIGRKIEVEVFHFLQIP